MRYFYFFANNDIKNIRRDSLLLYILFMPWLLVLLIRLLIPGIRDWFAAAYHLGLEQYYPLVLSFFIILEIPLIFGLVFGLLLLDERDDNIFAPLQVTPVSVDIYVIYRFLVAALMSVIYVMLALPFTGILKQGILLEVLPVALLGGMLAVFILLVLVGFARNKVEGLALMKGLGILMLGPMAAYFIDSKWQLLLGVLPSYWPAKSFWLISKGEDAWFYLMNGFIYTLFLIIILMKRFRQKTGELG